MLFQKGRYAPGALQRVNFVIECLDIPVPFFLPQFIIYFIFLGQVISQQIDPPVPSHSL